MRTLYQATGFSSQGRTTGLKTTTRAKGRFVYPLRGSGRKADAASPALDRGCGYHCPVARVRPYLIGTTTGIGVIYEAISRACELFGKRRNAPERVPAAHAEWIRFPESSRNIESRLPEHDLIESGVSRLLSLPRPTTQSPSLPL